MIYTPHKEIFLCYLPVFARANTETMHDITPLFFDNVPLHPKNVMGISDYVHITAWHNIKFPTYNIDVDYNLRIAERLIPISRDIKYVPNTLSGGSLEID